MYETWTKKDEYIMLKNDLAAVREWNGEEWCKNNARYQRQLKRLERLEKWLKERGEL